MVMKYVPLIVIIYSKAEMPAGSVAQKVGLVRQEKSGIVKSGGYSAENNLSIFIRGGEGNS
jgi:hypothetical protein